MTQTLSASAERELVRRAKHKLAVLCHVEEGLRDRSSAPYYSPRATQVEVMEKILRLRQQYHFGPQKIAMYLKRYHDITISSSEVGRILKKVGLGRLPASQRYKRKDTRWKRYEMQRPGHALQVDVKFIEPLGQTG